MSSTADGLLVRLSCINLKPAKTADMSVSDLRYWLVLVLPCISGQAPPESFWDTHTSVDSDVAGSEQLLAGWCVSLQVDVGQLRGEISCCHSVVLRPFVCSWPSVVLQDSLHLAPRPWCISYHPTGRLKNHTSENYVHLITRAISSVNLSRRIVRFRAATILFPDCFTPSLYSC